MPAAIRTDSLSKIYVKRRSLREIVTRPFGRAARVTGLRAVSLEIPPGQVFGILGPNGAGKTTLLKILACLILPTGGRAFVDGVDVSEDDRRVKRQIGFVTADERSFYWRLTGRENLHFFSRLYGLEAGRVRERTREVLECMGLEPVADQQFMAYSSGMKQRMAIARALLHDPPILCLDEPTRSLDPIAAKHLRRFVTGRLNRDQGKTILLATHNLQEAEEMCDRLAVLDRGRVLRQGSVGEITSGLPGRDHYLLSVSGYREVRPDPRWAVEVEDGAGRLARVRASVDRGGAALSDLLRAILDAGATIVSCTRREPSLQEVFDLMDARLGEEER
ncbi:MAG: ATP-binding cassette domain-containing protein [Acidobacteriota bacterium]